jgi:hypothetical protein
MPPGAGVTTWWPRLQGKRGLWRLGSGCNPSFWEVLVFYFVPAATAGTALEKAHKR